MVMMFGMVAALIMVSEYTVRDPVRDQIDGAVVCLFEHLGCDLFCPVIVQGPVEAADRTDMAGHGADIVRYHEDGDSLIELGEEVVEARRNLWIDRGGRFIQE